MSVNFIIPAVELGGKLWANMTHVRQTFGGAYQRPVNCPDGWRFFDGERFLTEPCKSEYDCWEEMSNCLLMEGH
jgi:hypothetical protein